jgi:uncharacterized membrane protein YphA (DoxX/SURF4 family)
MLIRSVISLCSRVVLAVILMTHAVLSAAGYVGSAALQARSDIFVDLSGSLPFQPMVHALAVVAAIWILFGIQTRIAAIVGLIAYGLCLRAETLQGFGAIDVLALAGPVGLGLIVCLIGGGRFSIYRDDWRQLL